ncbi:cytochrome P450 4C1-like [Photinus pyralis]|nr:cytochrome P450 4C1-like [Photinus pyralis]
MEKYGSILKIWMFNALVVVVAKPKHVQIILTKCLEKETRYKFAKDAFGNSLLTAPVATWRSHRKTINPAFSQQILDSFVDIFVKHSQILVRKLEEEVDDQKTFDVHEHLSRCSLDIICETAMGTTVDAQTKPSKLLHATRRGAQILVERCVRLWLHPNITFRLSQRGRELKEVLDYVQGYTGNLVRKRYEEFHSRIDDNFRDTSRKPFLEHLLSLGDQMTFLELRNEVDLFITAGSDTVTTTTGYVLVCLGMYQHIQQEIIQEIDEIFGISTRPITRDDLPKLKYMERVIKETMRLYPPVPLIARSVTEDIDLGELILPAGCSVVVGIIGMHRDPETWTDPLKFDPDRFTSEEAAKRHPYSYIPFSGGPRNCIGIKFSMMAVKVLLATILRSYKIHTDIKPQDIKLSVEIVSKMIGGANISISKR